MEEHLFIKLCAIAKEVPQLEYNSDKIEKLRDYIFSESDSLGPQILLLYKLNSGLRGCDLAKVLMKETFPNVIYRHKNYRNPKK